MYVRTAGDPLAEAGAVRQAVRAIDPNVPLFNIQTLEQQIDANLATDRMVATLSTFFSLLAALVAAIGLYGVMTYSMTRRTREIGIRMALGAEPSSLVRDVMGEVVVLVLAGIALGVPCALGLGRLVGSLLYEVKPDDYVTLVSATVLAIIVTLIAGYLPARRAASIDPTVALRCRMMSPHEPQFRCIIPQMHVQFPTGRMNQDAPAVRRHGDVGRSAYDNILDRFRRSAAASRCADAYDIVCASPRHCRRCPNRRPKAHALA